MRTTCPDCGARLAPLFTSWFCPKCEGGTAPDMRAAVEKIAGGPNYFRRGHYTVIIDRVAIGYSRTGSGFVTIDATVKRTHVTGEGLPSDWHFKGEQVTHLLKHGNPGFMPMMKKFVAAISDLRPDEVTSEMCELVTASDNPCAGAVLEANNRLITTSSGHSFTRIGWKKKKKTP